MIVQGELAKSAGSETNPCEQLLSPNYSNLRPSTNRKHFRAFVYV